jgi:acetyl-CoA synthetase
MQERKAAGAARGLAEAGARGLSTARAALQVLHLLARHPDGVRADEVAEALGKSSSTAYNLLASLCEEGVAARHATGRYALAPGFRRLIESGEAPAPPAPPARGLVGVVDELFARTHKRSYLALVESGRLHIVLTRGQQGMPRIPRLSAEIHDEAHALAIGKVALAMTGGRTLERYLQGGLRAFTDRTITETEALVAELAEVRRTGIAADRAEFDGDFCCLAAPIVDREGGFLGGVGISMSPRSYGAERDELVRTMRDVVRKAAGGTSRPAGFQAYDETHEVLDHPERPAVASSGGRSVQ